MCMMIRKEQTQFGTFEILTVYFWREKSHHRCDQRLTQIVQRGCEISNLKVVKNSTVGDSEQSPLSTRGPAVVPSNINYSVTTSTSDRESRWYRQLWRSGWEALGISLQRNRIWGIASYRIMEQPRLEETLKDHCPTFFGKRNLDEIIWHPVQLHLENLQRQKFYHMPWEVVPVVDCSQSKNLFFVLSWNLSWYNFHPLPFVFSLCLLVKRKPLFSL